MVRLLSSFFDFKVWHLGSLGFHPGFFQGRVSDLLKKAFCLGALLVESVRPFGFFHFFRSLLCFPVYHEETLELRPTWVEVDGKGSEGDVGKNSGGSFVV